MNEETSNGAVSRRRGPRSERAVPLALTLALLGGPVLQGCAQLPALSDLRLPGASSERSLADTEAQADADLSTETAASEEPTLLPEPQEKPKPGQLFEWTGDGRRVSRIVIDTDAQRARFYAGDEQIGWTTVATGVPSHATPSGEFIIIEKVANKRSNLYGKIVNNSGKVIKHGADARDGVPAGGRFVGASMPHFMRMTYDGIGMHAGPIPNPGRPASHGCIRMPKKMASAVFRHIEPGTPVTVIGSGPDYGNYAERVRQRRLEEEARRAAAAAAEEGTALDALDAEIDTVRRAEEGAAAGSAGTSAALEDGSRPSREPEPGSGDPSGADEAQAAADEPAAALSEPDTEARVEGARADAPPAAEDAAPNDGSGDEPDYDRPPAPPPQMRSAGLPGPVRPLG